VSGTKRVLIVGNSAAGTSAAEAVRQRDRTAEVKIIGAELHLAYHRPRLTYVLGKSVTVDTFLLHPREWYVERDIEVLTGRKVVGGGAGYVGDDTGSRHDYDALVLATGGMSAVPPLPGGDLLGVFSLRTYADLKAIESYSAEKCRVAIIGGGLLGLEAAWSFRQWGKEVSVLERGAGLLKNQLDEGGMKAIDRIVASKGVDVIYTADTACIAGDGKAGGIVLKDSREIDCDIVLLSTGVRSDVALAKALGLKVVRGIVVDERMSAAEGIFAAGDAAEFNGKVMGAWPVATEQGRVAGENAVGGQATYQELVPSNTTMVMGATVFSAGDAGRGEGPYKTLESSDGDQDYKKLYFRDQRLVGAILIGGARKALKVKALVDRGADLPAQMLKHVSANSFLDAL
jgi:nitrite reductase (NADH) large subunit